MEDFENNMFSGMRSVIKEWAKIPIWNLYVSQHQTYLCCLIGHRRKYSYEYIVPVPMIMTIQQINYDALKAVMAAGRIRYWITAWTTIKLSGDAFIHSYNFYLIFVFEIECLFNIIVSMNNSVHMFNDSISLFQHINCTALIAGLWACYSSMYSLKTE